MLNPIFQIKKDKATNKEGIFIIEPLDPGYGNTLGTALRRVLFSSLPGAAVTYVKIAGVRHQFSTLDGLKEDIVELILNIKKLRVRYNGDKPVKITIDVAGPGEIKAEKIEAPASVEIVNKDLVLGNLSEKKSKFSCEMTIEKGYGYSPFEERESQTLGVIPIDAAFSPVTRVNYRVEATRVGRITNYDRLILEINTDGTISPQAAMIESAKILVAYFNQVVDPKKVKAVEEESTKSRTSLEVYKLSVEELNLPTRITNALEKSGFKTIEELLSSNKKEVSKVKNLGTKSVKIIEAALKEKGVGLPE